MLFILTGDIQIGKTCWLQALVSDLEAMGCPCSGVVAPGVWRPVSPTEGGGFEKLGIDNELLPGHERVRFARRRDLAQAEGSYDATSQSAQANLGWAIDDIAIERVNAHFATLSAEAGACAVEATARMAEANGRTVEEAFACASEVLDESSARVRGAANAAHGGLLVIDELGQLELRRDAGLTEAVRLLDAGPTERYPVALVVVRDWLAPLARARFAPAWGAPALISPDERGRESLVSALGV